MNKITTVLAAAAAAAAMIAPVAAGAGTAAPASRGPVIYQSMGAWQHPQRRPGIFPLGALFWLSGMHWIRWSSEAVAHGTDNWADGAAGPLHRWPTTVTLSRVRSHDGTRYYTRMTLASRGHRTMHLVYKHGGIKGWLQQ